MKRLVLPAFTAPVAWHGFRPPRRPAGRSVVFKDVPPPEDQIARQVRSATGFTWGRATVDGARMPHAFAHGPKPSGGKS